MQLFRVAALEPISTSSGVVYSAQPTCTPFGTACTPRSSAGQVASVRVADLQSPQGIAILAEVARSSDPRSPLKRADSLAGHRDTLAPDASPEGSVKSAGVCDALPCQAGKPSLLL